MCEIFYNADSKGAFRSSSYTEILHTVVRNMNNATYNFVISKFLSAR